MHRSDNARRLQIERIFHDQRWTRAHSDIYTVLRPLLYSRHIYPRLQGVVGKRVLECGCGVGYLSVRLAKAGAEVHAFDISPEAVQQTLARAEAEAVSTSLSVQLAPLEAVDYPPNHFDLVLGVGVLHHVDLGIAKALTLRVLKPGGRAFFFEPLRGNPLITLWRRLTPHLRTPTERPLSLDEVRDFGRPFARFSYEVHYLTGLVALGSLAATRSPAVFQAVDRFTRPLDILLAHAVPPLRAWYGYVALEVHK